MVLSPIYGKMGPVSSKGAGPLTSEGDTQFCKPFHEVLNRILRDLLVLCYCVTYYPWVRAWPLLSRVTCSGSRMLGGTAVSSEGWTGEESISSLFQVVGRDQSHVVQGHVRFLPLCSCPRDLLLRPACKGSLCSQGPNPLSGAFT